MPANAGRSRLTGDAKGVYIISATPFSDDGPLDLDSTDRDGRVEEFATVAAFLASAWASYITGSVIRCDGGAIRSV